MLAFIRRGWAGQARPSEVFRQALLAFLVLLVLYDLGLPAAKLTGLKEIRILALLGVLAMGMIWCTWTAVALWRCAPNGPRLLGAVARLCAIGFACVVALTIYELVI
jgi:hypothetical protein